MGPIRAFSRPSHGLAAGELVASASPYSHTSNYSASRRPCCAHSNSSLEPHHSALTHPHLYGSVCVADPLRAGLVSHAAPPPCLFHFKKLLPPGAAPPDTHLAVPAQQDTRGASQGATRDPEGNERRKQDIYDHRWKNGSEHERKNKDERKSKKKSCENKWKKNTEESKWKQHNGTHRRHANESELKWEKFGDRNEWKKNKDENKWKNKKDNLKWKKEHKEQRWIKREEGNVLGDERREAECSDDEATPVTFSSPIPRANDPCTSRMPLVFPFSDDDDDDYRYEGKGQKESNEESWPISDIVETEDEGESHPGLQDTFVEDCEREGPLLDSLSRAVDDAEPTGVVQQQQLLSAAQDETSVLTQNGNLKGENTSSNDLRGAQEWQDLSSIEEKGELHKESDVDEELEFEEHLDHENEGKRKSGEDDWPRDGVRATQRLRPRSYRQFLLTRERRSRVFLKARSYHLGRWFVTHFTHPYPSKDQKDQLAACTSMTRNQVSEWFGNMRRRIREATRGLGVCWEERVRLYNTVITGKSEPLPIQPEDDINTWVPPVAEETASLDPQEEVCASPKFKKALMQRYLNNSFEAPPNDASGVDTYPPSTPIPLTSLEEDTDLRQEHHKFSESQKSSRVFSHPLPLSASSPKENVQARWNISFQHVKDTKFPAVVTKHPDKGDIRIKPFISSRGQGEEEGRLVRKYERQRNQDYSCATFKKQKTERDHFKSPRPGTSSSLPSDLQQAVGEGWRTFASTSTAQFQSSSWMVRRPVLDVRSSDEEGAAGWFVRKPEELDAAYTLMELHTDPAAAHLLAAPPRPPPLSS